MDDEILSPEIYLPAVLEKLGELQAQHPWCFDLDALESQPEFLAELVRKAEELYRLGPATADTVRRIGNEIIGVFDRAQWHRNGFDRLALDEFGQVVAVFVPRGGGFWASLEEGFESPDGQPVVDAKIFDAGVFESLKSLH